MATFTERIKIVIDVVGDKATSQLKGFRQAVGEAEGATGKFKAGVKSVGQSLSSFLQSPAAVASVSAAAAAAVGKLVLAAKDLGLAVGELRDRTGLNTEEASRWLEVTNDLGMSSDSLAAVLKKMSQSMDPATFKEFGIEIARTDTGATDISATFLNVIDRLNRIQDPAERARVAAKLLGKSWQDAAELISMGASEVEARLTAVGDAKVLNDGDVKAARVLRDNLDDLADAGEGVAQTLGQTLLPVLSKQLELFNKLAVPIADLATKFRESFDPQPIDNFATRTWSAFRQTALATKLGIKSIVDYNRALDDGTLSQDDALAASRDYTRAQSEASAMYGEYTRSLIDYRAEVDSTGLSEREAAATKDALARSAQAAAVAIDLERTANDNLLNGLDDNLANLNLITFFDDLPGRLAEIKRQYETGKIDARRYWLETAKELEGAKQKLADYLINVKGLDADYVMTLLADVTGAEGDIDRVLGKVAKFEKDKSVFLERNGVAMGQDATGGYAAGVTLVGEQGPELVDLPGGSTVYNRVATGRLLGSINQPASLAAVSNVTVNVMSADPQAVVGAIKKYTARGGQV